MSGEARIVLSAVDQTKAAFQSVKGSLNDTKASALALQGGIAGLAGSLGLLGLGAMVKSTVEAAASMKDLSTVTGASVESLSQFSSVAKLSGTELDIVGEAMNRLAKKMSTAAEGGNGAAAALRAIGVDFKDFQAMSPDQKMIKLAQALDGFSDGSGKSAVAMALMEESGARLLPFLRDLAVAGDIQAKTTTAQAEQSRELMTNFKRLGASGEAWKKELVQGMTPALNDAVKALVDVTNGTGGLRDGVRKLNKDGAINEWTRSAIMGASYVIDAFVGVQRVIGLVGRFIAASVASSVEFFSDVGMAAHKALTFNFSGAADTVKAGLAKQKSIWTDFGNDLDNILGESTLGKKLRDRMQQLNGVSQAAKRPRVTSAVSVPATARTRWIRRSRPITT